MNSTAALTLDRCWSRIGVTGDRSCPELAQVIHCRNCEVHQAAGRSLLDREVPEGYLQNWVDLQENELEDKVTTQLSVVVFRLEAERFALPASLFKEVTPMNPVHKLPHRSNSIFRGLVNIRGELRLCISLTEFLDLPLAPAHAVSRVSYPRMVVVEKDGNAWVFMVDELYGVERVYADAIESLPSTVAKAKETYTKGILRWQNHSVSYLDDELLLYALARKVLG